MNLAAHPDDEDGQTLAYYRHAQNAATYSIIYTRGEGGQNEIGPELYEQLGALRTQETERAARILGTKVYFLNYPDFGFSKFAREAFAEWGGEDAVTARIVYFVRKLKPDVMFTNHDTVTVGLTKQHGQHQAVGISAFRAFKLANDPTYHPEQLHEEGVTLWQPKRFFWRLWGASSGDVMVPVAQTDTTLGQSYQQLAMTALKEHATQGMDFFANRRTLPQFTYFRLMASATDAPLDPQDLLGHLEPTDRKQELPYYIDAGGTFKPLEGLAANTTDGIAVGGESVSLIIPPHEGTLRFWLDGKPISVQQRPNQGWVLELPPDVKPTLPQRVFQYERFQNGSPITYAQWVNGEIKAAGYLKLELAPKIDLEPMAEVLRLQGGTNMLSVLLHVYDTTLGSMKAVVTVDGPPQPIIPDMSSSRNEGFETPQTAVAGNPPWHQTFDLSPAQNGTITTWLPLQLPRRIGMGDYQIRIEIQENGQTIGRFQQPARVIKPQIERGLRVGLIRSYDNTLETALRELGARYRLLDATDLANGNFDDLQTIVVDIRAYLVRKDLREHNDQLLAWVKNGGNLIVNYQKTFEWNPNEADPFDPARKNPAQGFAPFPIALNARDRVTYQDAPVKVLHPEHPLFNYPNRITPEDWNGWIQERGLYFPRTYDRAYTELFEMNDPNEAPMRGSTLITTYGKGTYLYTALGWYRQLKVYHGGAYKMFANMLSLPITVQ